MMGFVSGICGRIKQRYGAIFPGFLAFFFLLGVGVWYFPWRLSEVREVAIPRGAPMPFIAQALKNQGVIPSETLFKILVVLKGRARSLQAGEYRFYGRLSMNRIVEDLVHGRVIYEKITLPEGLRAREIAVRLEVTLHVPADSFMTAVFDQTLMRALGVPGPSCEGYLFPDTYFFRRGIRAREIIEIMVGRFHAVWDDSMKARAKGLGLSLHEVVTLASIIEGEAEIAEERPIISALYHNRLKRGMLLQACPTVQYLLPEGPRRLLKKDLEIDSPYNTYRNPGLPPGPINNPGLASLKAALYPAEVPYLYLVANGDGSHTFSRTLDEHLRAKARFDRIRKRIGGTR